MKTVIRKSAALLAALALTIPASSSFAAAEATSTQEEAASGQIFGGYYRTWADKTVDASSNVTMDEIPASVGLAMVFPDYTPPGSPYWTALKNTYVPKLHAQGTKVVLTKGWTQLVDTSQPNTQAGYDAVAQRILDNDINPYGLDGLDVDFETRSVTTEQVQRVVGVMKAVKAKMRSDQLLILDTNLTGSTGVFRGVASSIDYLLLQAYGRDPGSLQGTWDTFKDAIPPSKFMIGVSLPEGAPNPSPWYDATAPFDSSRAAAYARWQPAEGTKAGMFVYALDRDAFKINGDMSKVNFPWSTNLKAIMDGTYVPGSFAG
ncbi:hypothetical protein [Haematomicrobium sanguinis]|uniref:EndoS/ChiA family endoglycosidase n=1 Tax=Haematomicrobium sanguinis TaxID=479106 RepID=UPI00068A40A0|nr:hypothetical protein [Haematomicrobium sanguinis]